LPDKFSIYEVIGMIIAGLGLFFIGVRLIGSSLRLVAGRRFRTFITKITYKGWVSAMFGIMSGAITQSTSAVTFIMTGMISAGLMTTRRAMPMVLWSNAGNCILVFLAVINFHLMVLYMLGMVGFLYYIDLDKSKLLKPAVGALLGVSLLFYGLDLMKMGAVPLRDYHWFFEFMVAANKSYILGLLGAAALAFIAQSAATISAIAIALANTGVLDKASAFMIIYGTNLGTACTTFVLSTKLKGPPKQLAIFQVGFKFFSLFIFVSLFYIEIYFHIPLVMALMKKITPHLHLQLALVYLTFQIVGAGIITLFIPALHRLLNKLFPETAEEQLSRPKFLHDQALLIPETALSLIEREQLRVLKRYPHYFDELREDATRQYNTAFLHIGTDNLIKEISDFTTELIDKELTRSLLNRILNYKIRAEILTNMDDCLSELILPIEKSSFSPELQQFITNISESLHTLLLIVIDVVESEDPMDINLLLKITEDKGEIIEKIHTHIRKNNPKLLAEEQEVMEYISSRFERMIWMIRYLVRLVEKLNKEKLA